MRLAVIVRHAVKRREPDRRVLDVLRIVRIRALVREDGFKGWQIARVVMFVAGVGIIVGLEFALDKTAINDAILYVIMMLTLGMMGTAVLKENK